MTKTIIKDRPIDRLLILLKDNAIAPFSFEKKLEIANGYVKKQTEGKGGIGSEVLEKIHSAYPEWDIMWLLFGANTPSSIKNNQYYKTEKTEDKPSSIKHTHTHSPPVTEKSIDATPASIDIILSQLASYIKNIELEVEELKSRL